MSSITGIDGPMGGHRSAGTSRADTAVGRGGSLPGRRHHEARADAGDHAATTAFVASLAVGLASAGWEPDRAVPELVAASRGDLEILDAACARITAAFGDGREAAVAACALVAAARQRVAPTGPVAAT